MKKKAVPLFLSKGTEGELSNPYNQQYICSVQGDKSTDIRTTKHIKYLK